MNMRATPVGGSIRKRPELSDRDFQRIAAIAKSDYGIQIEPQKKSMIQSRLTKRMRSLELGDFADYCALVEKPDSGERENFISSITTNVTHFYREVHHFKQLETEVLPPLVVRARSGSKLRVWSAGCSTGPEPYSIAGSITKLMPEAGRMGVEVLATDLDREVLAKAETATYDAEQCQVPAPEWGDRVFQRGTADGIRRVRPDVAGIVTFRQVNLNGAWTHPVKFDIIFCRNVAIYFDREVQQRLWQRFADVLQPGGTLFIGHSERVSGPAKDVFTPCGITAYRKRS
ncbi:MAG: protein-glutamate O-methyltransferase CheR [Pseudomonadota bacterium]